MDYATTSKMSNNTSPKPRHRAGNVSERHFPIWPPSCWKPGNIFSTASARTLRRSTGLKPNGRPQEATYPAEHPRHHALHGTLLHDLLNNVPRLLQATCFLSLLNAFLSEALARVTEKLSSRTGIAGVLGARLDLRAFHAFELVVDLVVCVPNGGASVVEGVHRGLPLCDTLS